MGDDDLRNRFRRDFTSQPIGQPRQPATSRTPASPRHSPAPAQVQQPPANQLSFEPVKPAKRREWPKKIIITAMITAIVLGGAAAYWFKLRPNNPPIPESIKQSAGFSLLYPASLPSGYHINPTSFSSANGAIIFEADNQAGGKIVFSEQRRPSTFDFPAFYKQGLGGVEPFNTPVGEAAIGKANNQTVGSITNDHAWMLVTSPRGLPADQLKMILLNTKPVSN